MAIAESGGPTTQAGISYQNAIAALYLGRMLDSRPFSVSQKVTGVRVEVPEHVDDIVITFSNEVKWYIQAKESISKGSGTESTWGKLLTDPKKALIVAGSTLKNIPSAFQDSKSVECKNVGEAYLKVGYLR